MDPTNPYDLTPVLIPILGVLGLVVGSFLNVVAWRVPRGESVVSPPSACPSCGHRIRSWDNVPVVSWLVLRGRCRDCGASISPRYLVVELVTGVAFAAVTFWVGASWALPALLLLAALTVVLTVIDLDVHRLPDAIVLPSIPVTFALLALASWNPGGEADWGALVRALVGAAALGLFYTALVVVSAIVYSGGGMGWGDAKLGVILGAYLAWVGWGALVVGAFGAFVVGGVFSIVLMVVGKAGRRSKIPFGPWMLAGAWLGLVVGERLWAAYTGTF